MFITEFLKNMFRLFGVNLIYEACFPFLVSPKRLFDECFTSICSYLLLIPALTGPISMINMNKCFHLLVEKKIKKMIIQNEAHKVCFTMHV